MAIPQLPASISAILFDIDGTLTHYPNRLTSVVDGTPPAFATSDVCNADSDGLRMFPDVAPAIRALHAAGFDLYTATTNASRVAVKKLALGGLASGNGSPYFKGLLGGDELSPGGKTSARFFLDLLAHYGLDSQSVLHVGDDPVLDVVFALEAGILNVAQIDRGQQEPVRALDSGGISINSLRLLPALLGRSPVLEPGGAKK